MVTDGSEVRIPVEDERDGRFTLQAEVVLVDGAACAVVCHPHPAFGGRMDTPLVVELADALGAAGLSTVRFNFRGLDGSEGRPTGGSREHEDVRAVCAWARENGAPKVALVGYSFGALMALSALARGETASAYVAVGFPTTIVRDHADRLADVERALARDVPSLFISGDHDQFCELDRLRQFLDGHRRARLDVVEGDHFFAGLRGRAVAERVARFVREVC